MIYIIYIYYFKYVLMIHKLIHIKFYKKLAILRKKCNLCFSKFNQ